MLNIEVKVFIIITEVLIVHHSCYHGYRKKEQPNSPSRRTLGFQDSAEVYNCTHMEIRTNHHTHARVRVASRFPTFL